MNPTSAKNFIERSLQTAGITINGKNPWDIQIYDDNFYNRVLDQGTLGLGESFMDKWWDCKELDKFFAKMLRAHLDNTVKIPFHFYLKLIAAKIFNFQTKTKAKEVAIRHYDLGNDLFSVMLDKRMIYSCGYWKNATTLDDAQQAKLDLTCKKLLLEPGMRLLDIGCGWGGLAKFAAENYGVNVVGVTISEQQADYAREYCKGLPVEIRLQDYRDLNEKFDRVVSIGMFEHVGHINYSTYMQTVYESLNSDGLFLLHTIGSHISTPIADEWITKYIFPNGMLPNLQQISKSFEKLFILEDCHNFGAYYANTLMAWHDNFVARWPELKKYYDERFYRMWVYYLLSTTGAFRARNLQLWQIVLSKNGIVGGYTAPR